MELREYWHLFRKWLWLIVLSTVVGGGTAFVVSLKTPPVYQASTTLMVNQAQNPQATYQDIVLNERLSQTYAQLLTTRPVLDETAKRIGLSSLSSSGISVQPVRNTQLIKLSVKSRFPSMAALIANTLPQVFDEQNRNALSARYKTSKEGLQRELDDLQKQIDIVQSQLTALANADAAKRSTLELLLAQYRSSYASVLSNLESIRVSETREGSVLRIVEPADVPVSPVSPRTLENTLLAAIVGAMIGVGAAFLIEYLDDTVKSPGDVQRDLNVGTLAVVPQVNGEALETDVIAVTHPQSAVAEAYRALRTNIQFYSVDQPVRTLLVTSAMPREGKSVVSANLGVVMAQAGKKVALIGADLRRPLLYRILSLPNNRGLTNYLLHGNDSIENYLQPGPVDNLQVITSGQRPPNPAELLGSRRMAELIQQLREKVDIVIIDTPPIMGATDPLVLAPTVDGVLLVAEANQTRLPVLQQAATQIRQVGGRLTGVIINKMTKSNYSYYSYYYYYYYYGEDGEKARRRKDKTPSWNDVLSRVKNRLTARVEKKV